MVTFLGGSKMVYVRAQCTLEWEILVVAIAGLKRLLPMRETLAHEVKLSRYVWN